MERPVFKPIGTPVEELDTPALVVDLDLMDQNIETVHSFFREQNSKIRPHVGTHRCPAIAHRQMAAGGTVGGVSVTTVGEAEVFAQSGFSDISIANEIVTIQKILRVCSLAQQVKITIAVDNPDNVSQLSEAATNAGVTLNAVVDIHTGLERCGVEPGRPAVTLATAISNAPNLKFAGLMSYEGTILADDADALASESRKWIQMVLDTRQMVEPAGLVVDVVLVGGPPCQGFSTLGAKLSSDPRNLLFEAYARLAEALEPEVVVVENVRAIATMYGGRYKEFVLERFARAGYRMPFDVPDAHSFGVPQQRPRAFFGGPPAGLLAPARRGN